MNEDRLSKIEQEIAEIKVRVSVVETVHSSTAQAILEIKQSITDIRGDLKWGVRVFLGAIVLALAAFVIKGGLNLV